MITSRFNYLKSLLPQPARSAARKGVELVTKLRPGQDPQEHIPPELRERLQHFPITREIGQRALNALVAKAEWFSLPGGATLARDGDNDQAAAARGREAGDGTGSRGGGDGDAVVEMR